MKLNSAIAGSESDRSGSGQQMRAFVSRRQSCQVGLKLNSFLLNSILVSAASPRVLILN